MERMFHGANASRNFHVAMVQPGIHRRLKKIMLKFERPLYIIFQKIVLTNTFSLCFKLIVADLIKFSLDTNVFRRVSLWRFAHFEKNYKEFVRDDFLKNMRIF
jgi:hypothetical protein